MASPAANYFEARFLVIQCFLLRPGLNKRLRDDIWKWAATPYKEPVNTKAASYVFKADLKYLESELRYFKKLVQDRGLERDLILVEIESALKRRKKCLPFTKTDDNVDHFLELAEDILELSRAHAAHQRDLLTGNESYTKTTEKRKVKETEPRSDPKRIRIKLNFFQTATNRHKLIQNDYILRSSEIKTSPGLFFCPKIYIDGPLAKTFNSAPNYPLEGKVIQILMDNDLVDTLVKLRLHASRHESPLIPSHHYLWSEYKNDAIRNIATQAIQDGKSQRHGSQDYKPQNLTIKFSVRTIKQYAESKAEEDRLRQIEWRTRRKPNGDRRNAAETEIYEASLKREREKPTMSPDEIEHIRKKWRITRTVCRINAFNKVMFSQPQVKINAGSAENEWHLGKIDRLAFKTMKTKVQKMVEKKQALQACVRILEEHGGIWSDQLSRFTPQRPILAIPRHLRVVMKNMSRSGTSKNGVQSGDTCYGRFIDHEQERQTLNNKIKQQMQWKPTKSSLLRNETPIPADKDAQTLERERLEEEIKLTDWLQRGYLRRRIRDEDRRRRE